MSNQYMNAPKQPWASSQFAEPSPSSFDSRSGYYPQTSFDPRSSQYPQTSYPMHQTRQAVSDDDFYGMPERKPMAGSYSRFNPKNWSKRTLIIVPIVAVIILIIIIVGAVVGTRSSKYPDYSYLHYTQTQAYSGTNFFNEFTYFNEPDPAQGVPIIYDSQIDAQSHNVTGLSASGRPYLQLNTTVPADGSDMVFAHSARITSTQTYDDGLFLFDVYHSPYGCAVWPAVWLTGPLDTWPAGGEIDIIEAVNKGNTGVQTTLHTSNGCKMDVKRKMSGKSLQTDCRNSTNANAGCGVEGAPATFGEALNQAGGGVWALEWRSQGIRSWFFPRATIPADVQAGLDTDTATPDPTQWGEPLADFPSTDCDIGSHFKNMSLIANIDTCGQYAGGTFNEQCGTGTCADYVQANRDAFGEAYWEFGAWKVFSAGGTARKWRLF